MQTLFIKGKRVDDQNTKVCVLYSPKDGRVVHFHGATVVPGADPVSDAEMEKRAVRHAAGLGREVEGVKALHVPYSTFVQHSKGFKVNAEGTGLVSLDLPAILNKRRPGR
jgi:hypothetical protein